MAIVFQIVHITCQRTRLWTTSWWIIKWFVVCPVPSTHCHLPRKPWIDDMSNLGLSVCKLMVAVFVAVFVQTLSFHWSLEDAFRSSGYQRHGMRISQCDKKAIYLVEVSNMLYEHSQAKKAHLRFKLMSLKWFKMHLAKIKTAQFKKEDWCCTCWWAVCVRHILHLCSFSVPNSIRNICSPLS